MRRSLTLPEMLDLLEQREVPVVMPTARAAGFLRTSFGRRQRQAGKAVWVPPEVLAWPQWTGTLWTDLVLGGHELRLLLNAAQEEAVWRELIAADESTTPLTPVNSLAKLAQSGWALAASYGATGELRRSANSHDARTFAGWAELFAKICGERGYLPSAGLEGALAAHVADGRVAAPERVVFCGFARFTPAQRRLLDALERAGTAVQLVEFASKPRLCVQAVLPNEPEELRSALLWLRERMEARPDGAAALLVPGLESERAAMEPVLREVLAPELHDVAADLSSTPWTVSRGAPLSDAAMVSVLLDVARWARGPLGLDRISELLLSSYFCPPEELGARARFDVHTLQRAVLLRPEVDLRGVLGLAQGRHGSAEVAGWLRPLVDLAGETTQPPRRPYAEWTEWLRRLAKSAGWPGVRPLTAGEFAVQQAFDAVLDLVATLDFAGKRVSLDEALEAIARQAEGTATPSAAADAGLQILTPEEAEGMAFEAAVYLRATDANLPAAAKAHPLMEYSLQRRFGMPGADAEAAPAEARRRMEQLVAGTAEVLFTSAAQNTEGALRASALPGLPGAERTAAGELPVFEAPEAMVAEEIVPDDVPLPPIVDKRIRGGSHLLKLQAACGFRAFAEMRLGGRELERVEAGFDAAESGTILHGALESFWKRTQSRATLWGMSSEQRVSVVEAAIEDATKRLVVGNAWDREFLLVTKQRMRRLMLAWLDHELQRGPFTVIGSEQDAWVEVGPLELHVRMDRIDRVESADGTSGFVLVDYKTGKGAKPAAWETDRPDEPQLPLYALLMGPEEVRGLAFAKIRSGKEMEWSGLQAELGILPPKGTPAKEKVTEFGSRVPEWEDVLRRLAQDFHDGISSVDPKDYKTNCKRCSQRLVCRVDVAALMARVSDAEFEEDEEFE